MPLPEQRRIDATGGAVTVWSGVRFEGPAARVIRALKEDGRTTLARSLAPALRAALARLGAPDAVLVPLPTCGRHFVAGGSECSETIAARAGLARGPTAADRVAGRTTSGDSVATSGGRTSTGVWSRGMPQACA